MDSASQSTVSKATYANSKLAYERSCRSIAGGVNSNVRLKSAPCPLTFDHGEGSRLFDVDGNEYVDFAMGMGPHILGHNPPAVVQAVRESLNDGQLFAGQHRYEAEFAELLVNTVPWVNQLRIGLSGTEMNLLALRICRAQTGRQKFVRFEGHYHGWLDPLFMNAAAIVDPDTKLPPLTRGQSDAANSDAVVVPWNDLTALEEALTQESIAAVLMEPIMCNTGFIRADENYLARAKALCEKHGTILIVDEVITGFRIGLRGAQDAIGATGHMTVYAKAIASGFAVAVLGADDSNLLEHVGTGKINHSGTYNTGVTSIAAGIATVKTLLDNPPYEHMERLGKRLTDGLEQLGRDHGYPLQVDGPGPVCQLRFGAESAPSSLAEFRASTDNATLETFMEHMQHRGVRTTSRGLMFLSAAHTDADIDHTVDAADSTLAEMNANK